VQQGLQSHRISCIGRAQSDTRCSGESVILRSRLVEQRTRTKNDENPPTGEACATRERIQNKKHHSYAPPERHGASRGSAFLAARVPQALPVQQGLQSHGISCIGRAQSDTRCSGESVILRSRLVEYRTRTKNHENPPTGEACATRERIQNKKHHSYAPPERHGASRGSAFPPAIEKLTPSCPRLHGLRLTQVSYGTARSAGRAFLSLRVKAVARRGLLMRGRHHK